MPRVRINYKEQVEELKQAMEILLKDHVTLALTCEKALRDSFAYGENIEVTYAAKQLCKHVKDRWTTEEQLPTASLK